MRIVSTSMAIYPTIPPEQPLLNAKCELERKFGRLSRTVFYGERVHLLKRRG